MPHQCLQCGHAFAEGSSELLRGCPECKGTKFFYSANPVDADARKELADQAKADLQSVVTEILSEKAPEAMAELQERAGEDGWATIKPRDLRRIVKQVQQNEKAVEQAHAPSNDAGAAERQQQAVEEAKARMAKLEAAMAADDEEEKPDTVTVHDAGEYELDVRGLMEKDPLVVHRDGAYMIHLPSLFEGRD